MNFLTALVFTVAVLVKTVSLQQPLMCIHCTDCYAIDRSFWIPRSCDDDSPPPGGQTTPGLPIIPGFSAQNETTQDVVPLFDQASNTFQCFTITIQAGGRHMTNRGCAVRGPTHDETCRRVNANPVWCDLCENNNCNSGTSKVILSSSLLLVAFLVFVKAIV